mmetsp:Transcript_35695/g.70229  ORF Transcript_35695/g.70229 Transcript_35695/m.70229 type:complete len:129 (+) Transcript_35695:42-428(+)
MTIPSKDISQPPVMVIPDQYIKIVDNDTAPSAPPAPIQKMTTQQVAVTYNISTNMGRDACRAECAVCNQGVVSKVTHNTSGMAWCAAISLLLIFWPICWVPFVVRDCKDTAHHCPQCKNLLGKTEPCK